MTYQGTEAHLDPAGKRDADDVLEGLVVAVPAETRARRVLVHKRLDDAPTRERKPLLDTPCESAEEWGQGRPGDKPLVLEVVAPAEVGMPSLRFILALGASSSA